MRALFIPENLRAAAVKGLRRTGSTAGQSPDEIKRREVSWTRTKKLDSFAGTGSRQDREEGGGAGPSS